MAYSRLFIDSDILLDGILVREPCFKNSLDVMLLADNEKFICFTSVHCIINIHYLIKKRLGEQLARQTLRRLIAKIKIVKEDSDIIQQALDSNFADFEDAVQFYAAKSAEADVIITRNTKDYKNATIPVLTAEQFLREILK